MEKKRFGLNCVINKDNKIVLETLVGFFTIAVIIFIVPLVVLYFRGRVFFSNIDYFVYYQYRNDIKKETAIILNGINHRECGSIGMEGYKRGKGNNNCRIKMVKKNYAEQRHNKFV